MFKAVAAISCGASIGAVARWLLGLALNSLFLPIPIGTLTANLVGGYCIGLAVSFFNFFPALAPEWRLLCITGFLGGLTTFSTFSAEVTVLLQEQRFLMACGAIALHVCGSLLMTLLGIATFALFKHIYT